MFEKSVVGVSCIFGLVRPVFTVVSPPESPRSRPQNEKPCFLLLGLTAAKLCMVKII